MTAPPLSVVPDRVTCPKDVPREDLNLLLQFTGAEARALTAQAAAHGIGVAEYARRAIVQQLMASWDRPITRPAAAA